MLSSKYILRTIEESGAYKLLLSIILFIASFVTMAIASLFPSRSRDVLDTDEFGFSTAYIKAIFLLNY